MRGKKRCLRHGGKSPGAPKGRANGRYVHGLRTQELKAARALVRKMLATLRGDDG